VSFGGKPSRESNGELFIDEKPHQATRSTG
jgi:hypothetical protein